jgi:nucleoside-diphosphate-sugar epimerase
VSLRVLVLGADGFIGGHLVTALAGSDWATPLAAGRRAPAAGTSSASSAAGSRPAITRLQLDATDQGAIEQALRGADAVVSCISGSAPTIASSARALLAAAANQERPPRVVYLSSMAVYGAASGLVSESAKLAGTDDYARAKIAAEQHCARYPQSVVLRPGIVYGPRSRQWTERVGRWLVQHRVGDLGAAGDGCCNLVYVDDVVQAIQQCLRLPAVGGQAFNLAMPQPPSWNDYFIAFARQLGAVPVSRIGRRRLKLETRLLAPPLKIGEIVLRKAHLSSIALPEAIPPSLLRLWRQELRLDVTRAEQLLRLRWTALEQGLAQAASWFRKR